MRQEEEPGLGQDGPEQDQKNEPPSAEKDKETGKPSRPEGP